MRVQRTRSSASPPRSPLTRSPLGRSSWSWGLALGTAIHVLILCSNLGCTSSGVTSTEPLTLGSAGLAELSGDWSGTLEFRQTGQCTMGKSAKRRYPIHLSLIVDSDGVVTVQEYKSKKEFGPIHWSGALSQTLHLTALRVTPVTCSDGKSEKSARLDGQVARGARGPILEASGDEATCPNMGCTFALTYQLVKEPRE